MVTTNKDMNITASLNEDNYLFPNKNKANQTKPDSGSCLRCSEVIVSEVGKYDLRCCFVFVNEKQKIAD